MRTTLAEAIERLAGGGASLERHFREIFDHVFGFIGLLAPDGTVLDANRTSLEATGLTRAEVIGFPIWDVPCLPTGDVRQRLRAAVDAAATGVVVRYETNMLAGGETLTLDLTLKPIRAPSGEIVLIIPEARDVTAKRRADEAVRESEERFNRIVSIAADAIVSIDESQRITLFNQGAETIFGYAAHEVAGQPLDMLLPKDLGAAHGRHVRDFGESSTVARRMGERRQIFGRRKSGEVFPAEASISKTVLAGKPVFTAVLRDVSDRWAHEEERERLLVVAQEARDDAEAARARVAYLAEASDVLSASLDLDDTVRAMTHLLVPRQATVCMLDLIDADGRVQRVDAYHARAEMQHLADVLRRYPRNEIGSFLSKQVLLTGRAELRAAVSEEELAALAQDDEDLAALRALGLRSYLCVPLRARSRTLGALTVMRDAGDERYTELDLTLLEELAHRVAMAVDNARLYAEAQEAARQRDHTLEIVSHDLRNPLSAIGMCTTALGGLAGDAPDERGHLVDTIRNAVDWMQRLIRDLLDVSSIEAGRLSVYVETTDPAVIVMRAFEMFEQVAASKSLALEIALPQRLPPVRADEQRIVQVLANLLTNAVKFTDPSGHVGIRAEQSAGAVVFSVADDGVGIPAEDVPHVFDRFWHGRGGRSGRATPGGTGLGLAIARGIVEAHGGRIWVETTRGVGSVFRFLIPVADRGVASDLAEAAKATRRDPSHTIEDRALL